MNIWDDPRQYKPARAKTYEIYMCRPQNNTIVINSLEQSELIKELRGRCYFTAAEVTKMAKAKSDLFGYLKQCVNRGLAYAVNDKTPFVLSGTLGEMWCVDAATLMKKYQLITSNGAVMITPQLLQSRAKSGTLDWCKVRTVPSNSQVFACFTKKQQGVLQTAWGATLTVNSPNCKHGKGDFIIANRLPNGQINMQDRWVVNGMIFGVTYDNRGWADCLDGRLLNKAQAFSVDKLPKLVCEMGSGNKLFDAFMKLAESKAHKFDSGDCWFYGVGINYGGRDYDDPSISAKLEQGKIVCKIHTERGKEKVVEVKTMEDAKNCVDWIDGDDYPTVNKRPKSKPAPVDIFAKSASTSGVKPELNKLFFKFLQEVKAQSYEFNCGDTWFYGKAPSYGGSDYDDPSISVKLEQEKISCTVWTSRGSTKNFDVLTLKDVEDCLSWFS